MPTVLPLLLVRFSWRWAMLLVIADINASRGPSEADLWMQMHWQKLTVIDQSLPIADTIERTDLACEAEKAQQYSEQQTEAVAFS